MKLQSLISFTTEPIKNWTQHSMKHLPSNYINPIDKLNQNQSTPELEEEL